MRREWIYGRNPIYEALRARRRRAFRLHLAEGVQEKGVIKDVLSGCERGNIPVERRPRGDFSRFGSGHQGIALEVETYRYVSLDAILAVSQERDEPPFILLLDMLQDPHNLGALLRSAECLGAHGVCIPLRRTATITPAVVNTSAGASEHLLVCQANLVTAIQRLQQAGVWVVGLDSAREAISPQERHFSGPLAVVVGNEGQGLRPLVRRSCDVLVNLPMRGKVASLNASVAGSIGLYLAAETRRK